MSVSRAYRRGFLAYYTMDRLNFLVCAVAGPLLVFILAKWIRGCNLDFIPAVGPSGTLSSYMGTLRYLSGNSREMIQEGYNKYPGSMFRIPFVSRWVVVVSGDKLINDLRDAREDEISFYDASRETLQMKYTLGQSNLDNHYHVQVVRSALTRNLGARFGEIRDEIVEAFNDIVPLRDDEWTAVPALETILHIVARTSNRLFVGLPLCRNARYLRLNIEFAVSVMKTARRINVIPSFLRPLLAPWLSVLNHYQNLAGEHLTTIIQERFDHEDDWPGKPNDLITWLMDESPPHLRTVSDLTMRVLLVNFAAIHTSSNSFTEVLYHLAAEPHYLQPLREEVESVVKEEGWSKAALNKMHKIDSFLRESQRFTGLGCLNMNRIVKNPNGFKFSNGVVLPPGTMVAVASYSVHHDDNTYSDPNVFDGFRFSTMRQDVGEGTKHQMVSTGLNYIPFGHGRHACPGRFFAANELKAILAHIVITYDVKLENEGDFPTGQWFAANHIPDRTAKVMFRKRQEART